MEVKITIVDYDTGNLRNVQKAVEFLGYSARITSVPEEVAQAEALILPGVGHFGDGMCSLTNTGLAEAVCSSVRDRGTPILGICLGMQLLGEEGVEGGATKGLGLLPMSVVNMEVESMGLRVPHMGWNNVDHKIDSKLFRGIPQFADFYFVHSYHAVCDDQSIVAGKCAYGRGIVVALERDNIYATQFHPEKSQRYGLQLLQNFICLCEERSRCLKYVSSLS